MNTHTGKETVDRFARCGECGWNVHGVHHGQINDAAEEHRCPTACQRINVFAGGLGWDAENSSPYPGMTQPERTNYRHEGDRIHVKWTPEGGLLVAANWLIAITTDDETKLRDWFAV